MRISASLEEVLIPEFNGNKDLTANEQIRIILKRPTVAESENLRGWTVDPNTGQVSIIWSTRRILQNHVVSIENLEDVTNGKVVPIKTGSDLAASLNPRLRRLVDEIKTEIAREDVLSEDEEKN